MNKQSRKAKFARETKNQRRIQAIHKAHRDNPNYLGAILSLNIGGQTLKGPGAVLVIYKGKPPCLP